MKYWQLILIYNDHTVYSMHIKLLSFSAAMHAIFGIFLYIVLLPNKLLPWESSVASKYINNVETETLKIETACFMIINSTLVICC